MTRRRLFTLTGGLGGAIALAACGTAVMPAETMEEEKPAPEPAPTEAPAPEPYTISIFTVPFWTLSEGLGAEVVAEFEEQNPGLTVDPTIPEGNRVTQLQAAMAAGSGPDIGQSGSWQAQTLSALEIGQPLSPFMAVSDVVRAEDIWPSLQRDLTWQGQIQGMPFGPDVRPVYMNDTIYLENGVDVENPPASWEELEEAIPKLTRISGDVTEQVAFAPLWQINSIWMVPMWQLGGETLSDDGSKVTINTPEGIEGLRWLMKIYEMQGGWQALEDFRKDIRPHLLFYDGHVANLYWPSTLHSIMKRDVPDLQYHVAHWPTPPGGRHMTYGGCHTWILTTQSEQPENAWKFLEYFGSGDVNVRWSHTFNTLPIRPDVSRQEEYHQNDPFLQITVEMMENRRFVIPAPGAPQMLGATLRVVPTALGGEKTIEETLRDTEVELQTIMDTFLSSLGG
jgi:multiple sugar transport system substrate-binding protein